MVPMFWSTAKVLDSHVRAIACACVASISIILSLWNAHIVVLYTWYHVIIYVWSVQKKHAYRQDISHTLMELGETVRCMRSYNSCIFVELEPAALAEVQTLHQWAVHSKRSRCTGPTREDWDHQREVRPLQNPFHLISSSFRSPVCGIWFIWLDHQRTIKSLVSHSRLVLDDVTHGEYGSRDVFLCPKHKSEMIDCDKSTVWGGIKKTN